MSNRITAILLLTITFVVSKLANDGGAFVWAFCLGIGFVVPSKQEWKVIISKIHKQQNKARTYSYKPAIF